MVGKSRRWIVSLISAVVFFTTRTEQQGFDERGNIDFIDSFDPRPPGDSTNADGNAFRITGQNLRDIDFTKIDRRREEGWWHLYPFGERFNDADIAGRPWNDQQIDLDFFLPYYGFRYNYTFIFPEGFIAFSYPRYVQPPYTFPNPKWPDQSDPSLIAAFLSAQTTMFVGETPISHLWYRIISRPPNMVGRTGPDKPRNDANPTATEFGTNFGATGRRQRYYNGQLLKVQEGRVEDPDFLDRLTLDIRKAMVGTRGFTADYALLITWERMAYGGSPKVTQLNMYDQVKKWQNTYQMVIATDEIRTYVMFNYANINWTSSTSAGALFGRGGKQSAIVGFNGGNGTGFYQLPYSAEGNSYKLVQFGSTQTAGRWIVRADEGVIYGGCTNTSVGGINPTPAYISMLGGVAINMSGPCFRPNMNIKMQIDILTLDCMRIDMVKARCVIPVNALFKTGGMVDMKISIDGGKNYPWWGKAYIVEPSYAPMGVTLIDDPINTENNWKSPDAQKLTLRWGAANITVNPAAQIDIVLFGYWEDTEKHALTEIGSIARNTGNTGVYSFDPRTLVKTDILLDAWRRYRGGMIQVRVSGDWMADLGSGLYWSKMIPFGWYFRDVWMEEYGEDWALDICKDWYEWDGRRLNYVMDLEPTMSCPCTLNQALADFGRFIALQDCDMMGNSDCYYTMGAQHCVVSTTAAWNGAGQMCCYDSNGWLMFSDDYEYNRDYLRFYGAGVPYRAHPWGSYPYQRPPYVPNLSNFYNDLLPYESCCMWAGACEFYYYRRQSSACQEYKPSVTAYAYGQGHFMTFDDFRYPFSGKGYFVLTEMQGPRHNLNIQVRMEQPPKTVWDEEVPATIITGLAAADNGSATVQVFARKEFRRERYRLNTYVDGVRIFFDRTYKKKQNFPGVTFRSPPRNMNSSIVEIMFATGVGIKVEEVRGSLAIMVSLPFNYNQTYKNEQMSSNGKQAENAVTLQGKAKCDQFVFTKGLLGTFNGRFEDELTDPDCNQLGIGQEPKARLPESEIRNIYFNFGEKWRVDGARHPLLFQSKFKALYNPLSFGKPGFVPSFTIRPTDGNVSVYESLIFTRNQVRSTCQNTQSCEMDYVSSGRRETGLDTLSYQKKFEGVKSRGEQRLISCGSLVKNRGVIKYPIGNNYLDGVTVTFTCKPEYFLHGEQQRTCINGTWSPGWWVWCRSRTLETGLKWMTGVIVSLLILAVIVGIFLFCYCLRINSMKQKGQGGRYPRHVNPKNQTGPRQQQQGNNETFNNINNNQNNTKPQEFIQTQQNRLQQNQFFDINNSTTKAGNSSSSNNGDIVPIMEAAGGFHHQSSLNNNNPVTPYDNNIHQPAAENDNPNYEIHHRRQQQQEMMMNYDPKSTSFLSTTNAAGASSYYQHPRRRLTETSA